MRRMAVDCEARRGEGQWWSIGIIAAWLCTNTYLLLKLRRSSQIAAQGFYLGYQKEKCAQTLKALAKPRSRSWPTLSAFAGSVDGLSQGVATLYPGLALVHAFGVPVFVQSLATSSGVLSRYPSKVPRRSQHILMKLTRSLSFKRLRPLYIPHTHFGGKP